MKIGDRIKIKDYPFDYFPRDWVDEMDDIKGKFVHVEKVFDNGVVTISYNGREWYIGRDDIALYDSFSKDDIRIGMVVECCNGQRFLVVDGENYISNDGYVPASSYNNDLTDTSDMFGWDITRIYQPFLDMGFDDILKRGCSSGSLIWEREERKRMTHKEIEEALGYKVKIID